MPHDRNPSVVLRYRHNQFCASCLHSHQTYLPYVSSPKFLHLATLQQSVLRPISLFAKLFLCGPFYPTIPLSHWNFAKLSMSQWAFNPHTRRFKGRWVSSGISVMSAFNSTKSIHRRTEIKDSSQGAKQTDFPFAPSKMSSSLPPVLRRVLRKNPSVGSITSPADKN